MAEVPPNELKRAAGFRSLSRRHRGGEDDGNPADTLNQRFLFLLLLLIIVSGIGGNLLLGLTIGLLSGGLAGAAGARRGSQGAFGRATGAHNIVA